MQLRFTSFAVINLRRDLHPQECARAGRTTKTRPAGRAFRGQPWAYLPAAAFATGLAAAAMADLASATM